MADTAIALIIAGSGAITPEELNDLLNDAYPEEIEIGLLVPVDKDLYTDAVKAAVEWYDNDEGIYPIQTKGASLTRASAKLGEGTQEVDKFTDIIDPKEFEGDPGWDEVHVLLAMPEVPKDGEDDEEYEFYAEVADVALQAGFVVKDLTAGLDDIVVTDAEDATAEDPEPEPEPEKPTRTRRGRGKAAEEPEEVAEDTAVAEPPKRTRAKKAETIEEVKEAVKDTPEPVVDSHADSDNLRRIVALEQQVGHLLDVILAAGAIFRGPTSAPPEGEATVAPDPEKPAKAEDTAEAPKRGRGRPRLDFEVKQVWDETDEKWIPRPPGRMKKGTEWRVIHADTSEVLSEGTA